MRTEATAAAAEVGQAPLFPHLCRALAVAIPLLGIGWLVDLPLRLGYAVLLAEYVSVVAGLCVALALLAKPRPPVPRALDPLLALLGCAAWLWAAWNHEAWLLDIANRGVDKWLPAVVGLLLVIEGMRRHCGAGITVLVSVFFAYGFLGWLAPGPLEAAWVSPDRLVLYLYSDVNGVPGIVLKVAATIVLAFILLGTVMEHTGASRFFTDLAMAAMGRRRGGPAKVAVLASSLFGTVNGTTVGNILSTGIVTIPLMKRAGFPPRVAGAVEAVASNGGQIVPPIMGTTAFLIAEFLQVAYTEVVVAAILPAVLYYLALLVQIDRFAAREGIRGLPPEELPDLVRTLAGGWIFLAPLGVLLYFLFWLGYNPGKSALYATAVLLALGVLREPSLLSPYRLLDLLASTGERLLPLVLICAGAGIVIGVVQITGVGFSLVLVLAQIGKSAGLLAMLAVTASIAIVLGMGMPTAAVYVVLSVILAPALTRMGVPPMAAHLFIFYFGLLSMLTPPVAVASYVAANLAGAGLWETSLQALRFAVAAYLVPFLFVYEPALLFQETPAAAGVVFLCAAAAALLLACALEPADGGPLSLPSGRLALAIAALPVGTAPLWLGNGLTALTAPAAVAAVALLTRTRRKRRMESLP